MADNRFTFAVQRLPAGPSYTESFQDRVLYESILLLVFSFSYFNNLLEVDQIHIIVILVV